MKAPEDLVSGEGSLPVDRLPSSQSLHMAKGLRKLSGVSFIRILINSIREGATFMTLSPLKDPTSHYHCIVA